MGVFVRALFGVVMNEHAFTGELQTPRGGVRRVRGGLLLAFEGIDGAGKTTQAKAAVEELKRRGFDAVYLREPTDGPHGMKLRQLMAAGRDTVSPREEFELFLADRAYDVEHHIKPALDTGKIVCIDRYYPSSMAYQGALGLDPEEIRRANESFAPRPDVILLFRLPVEVGTARILGSRTEGQNLFEHQSYLEKVAAIFEKMSFPQMVRLDATLPPEILQSLVLRIIEGAIAGREVFEVEEGKR
ncbi:MAG: dTMP kinase [Candidatus Sumerlaeaceae bacterium]|nr:dTMP kinase [Candidatus Sumerlaeaceae bacterium]